MLSEVGEWRSSIGGLVYNSLSSVGSAALEFPFTKDEVFIALSSLCGDKTSGLDGFTLAFWRCWDFIF